MPRVALRGSARLACARPAVGGRSRSSHYLQPVACAHLTPRSAPPSKTPDVRSLGDRSAPARTCTTWIVSEALPSASCIDPPHEASRCADRSSASSHAGQRPAGSLVGPAAAAVSRALARLWSFLPLPGLVVPRESRGEENTRKSQPHECASPFYWTSCVDRRGSRTLHDGGLRRLRPHPYRTPPLECKALAPCGGLPPPPPLAPHARRRSATPARANASPRTGRVWFRCSSSVVWSRVRAPACDDAPGRFDRTACKCASAVLRSSLNTLRGDARSTVSASVTGQRHARGSSVSKNKQSEQQRTRTTVTLGTEKTQ